METIEFVTGRNCWRVSRVQRCRFLLSGRDYYKTLRSAMVGARESIYILAWDLSERIRMIRSEDDADGYPEKIGDFVFALLDENPDLDIHILLWDYSVVYLVEREWLPFTQWKKKGHPRLHFEVDNALPAGASHHQKLVVVDEALAFCGGFDLSAWRWDTTEHLPTDPRRKTPVGEVYQPLHDIQMMVQGDVVKDLSDLCAMRWERATGKPLPRLNERPADSDWLPDVPVDIENQEVALALTFSRYEQYSEAFHNEQLYLDIIGAAADYIYIENQYLSSHKLVSALAERLAEENGPEVVIVLTRDTGGWMEEGTMGVLRDRLLEILKQADKHGRFCAFYPFVKEDSEEGKQIYVHAKLMIVDDQLIRCGSSNLSNRSMRVDSELDLIFQQSQETDVVRSLLERLLAIHFHVKTEEIKRALDASDCLGTAIKTLKNGKHHFLHEMKAGNNPAPLKMLADSQILDPDEPIGPGYWISEALEHFGPEEKKKALWPGIAKACIGLFLLLGLVYLIKTGWSGVVTKESAIAFIENIRSNPATVPILFVTFIIAGLIAFPINLLLIASTVVIGPWITFAVGLSGSLLSSVLAFGIGHSIGKPLVRKLFGEKLKKLSKLTGSRGLLSVAMLRILPIAPFPVINLAAGSSGLPFRTFLAGSALGMFPGMLGVVLVTAQFESAALDPNLKSILMLVSVVLLVGGGFYYLHRRLRE